MEMTVAVLGDALLDVSVTPTEPMRRGGDVPAAVHLAPGGQGANLAVRLARRGVRTRLSCGLADDAVARLLREALERERVEVLHASVPSSGVVAVLVEDAERTMLSQREPFAGDVDVTSLVGGAGWLVISGYVLLEAHATGLARRCAALDVRRAVLGCDVPAERVADWHAAAAALRPDVVFLNTDEAAALAALPPFDALVVVTRRDRVDATGRGFELTVAGDRTSAEGVDSTGAGDAFAAAVIAALGARWPANDEALRTALVDGMSAARRVAAVPGAQGLVEGERAALS